LKNSTLIVVVKLRVSIGLLGQGDQCEWWSSLFFSGSSAAFLDPVFSKTSFLSRYYGTKEAAMVVHDRHIGIGKEVFHLFRLPERIERDLHQLLGEKKIVNELLKLVENKDTAINYLDELAGAAEAGQVGPVRVGSAQEIEKTESWQKIARHYLSAFQNSTKIFPYFSEAK